MHVFEDKIFWSYRILVGKSSGKYWVGWQRGRLEVNTKGESWAGDRCSLGGGVLRLDLG